MATRDDINFRRQNLLFEEAVEQQDHYVVRELADKCLPEVLNADISNAEKVAQLKNILRFVQMPAAEKFSEDIEKGQHWEAFEIADANEKIVNKLLEQIINLTPQGFDDDLTVLAKQVAINNDGGERQMQYHNPDCLRLMNAIYQKRNNKQDFKYPDLIAAYQYMIKEEDALKKTQTREEKRKNERSRAYARLDEIKEQLKTNISPIDKLDLLDEAIELSSQKYFSPSTANSKRTGYCEQALAICRQELPWRKDLKIRYEDMLKRYDVQRKHIKNRQIRNNKSVGVFTR